MPGGLLFLLLILLVFSGILVLFTLAHTAGLYESAFTYQNNILPSKSDLFTFAPYSIAPTLLAVIVSLWWENVDEVFRRLQPFVTMSQKAVPVTSNVGLSYVAAYPVWTVIKALRNCHWFVALVSTGAIITQVLTVSMSALWQRADGSRPASISLTRSYEPRRQPHVYTYATGDSMGAGDQIGLIVLANFYEDLSTNWLYSATLELVYNGSQPDWSRDGWSFVPMNLGPITESRFYKHTPADYTSAPNSAVAGNKSANATITTPALRGTVDPSD